jgi:hypothetical protein
MPTGTTITDTLNDSLDSVVAQARIVRENAGVMTQLADKVTLGEGVGNTWKEISMARLTAMAITETTEEDNPQQFSDTAISITPSMVSVYTVWTDRAARNISKKTWAKTGGLSQNAIQRKKDIDGLTVLDGATTSLSGAGTTLTSGVIAAAASRIRANTTEPWDGPVAFVLHGFQKKDLFDEVTAGIGTYPIPNGSTADVYKNGFTLGIDGSTGFVDNNISIDSSDDAKGGVFASGRGGAIVLCQARAPWVKTVRDEFLGGGATKVLHRDEYAYGERSAGNWLFEIFSDALAPTS